MLNFSTFVINEAKNTHLTHAADLVFEGYARTNMAIQFVQSVSEMLTSSSKSKMNVTRKWDGAPAVFCGIHPETDKFFVGTKSVFNKNPKINYTNADIDRNHGHAPGLVDKLKVALKQLNGVVVGGIYQGDLLYTKSDLSTQTIDGEKFITFTPNTITYAIPVDSDMAKRIKQTQMGIAFHTKYTGKDMMNMKASFGVTKNSFKHKNSVLVEDATYIDQTGSVTFTTKEKNTLDRLVNKAQALADSNKGDLNWLSSQSKVIALLNIYTNQKVRAGELVLRLPEFIAFIRDRYEKEAAGLKREANQKNKLNESKQLVSMLNRKRSGINNIFKLHEVLNQATLFLINKLEGIKSYRTFLQRPDGFEATGEEGFVASDHLGNVVKLVDRLQFSRANFQIDKNWIRGG